MRLLGISAFYSAFYHERAAALVHDGEVVAAAQEERFTRKKQVSCGLIRRCETPQRRQGNLERLWEMSDGVDMLGLGGKPSIGGKLKQTMALNQHEILQRSLIWVAAAAVIGGTVWLAAER